MSLPLIENNGTGYLSPLSLPQNTRFDFDEFIRNYIRGKCSGEHDVFLMGNLGIKLKLEEVQLSKEEAKNLRNFLPILNIP